MLLYIVEVFVWHAVDGRYVSSPLLSFSSLQRLPLPLSLPPFYSCGTSPAIPSSPAILSLATPSPCDSPSDFLSLPPFPLTSTHSPTHLLTHPSLTHPPITPSRLIAGGPRHTLTPLTRSPSRTTPSSSSQPASPSSSATSSSSSGTATNASHSPLPPYVTYRMPRSLSSKMMEGGIVIYVQL